MFTSCLCHTIEMDPSLTGLALVYSLQLMGLSSISIRYFAQVETAMTSLERVRENLYLPRDGGTGKGGSLALDDAQPNSRPNTGRSQSPLWPTEGRVEFVNVNFRYRPELPLVLRDLTLSIAPRENFGICGRTGSGKSSIIQCLLRLFEIECESQTETTTTTTATGIFIDGVSTRHVDLHTLRSSIALVPQDPVREHRCSCY